MSKMNGNNNTTGNGYTHKSSKAQGVDDEKFGKLVLKNPQDLYRRNF